MGAFELDSCTCDKKKSLEEQCIIAYKIYDQCRAQICLTPAMLGPARALTSMNPCMCQGYDQGEIIVPPVTSTSVSINNFQIGSITILSKKPNPFRNGFWDVEIKFVFTYTLVFRNACNADLAQINAFSVYKTKVTLYGACASDVVTATDLFGQCAQPAECGPFVTVEAKGVGLAAELRFPCCCDCNCGCNDNEESPTAVNVTLGLFAIYKIFRPVNLCVESSGFCIPEECACASNGVSAVDNPCDFFDSLEFPLNIFAPPESCGFAGCKKTMPAKKCGC